MPTKDSAPSDGERQRAFDRIMRVGGWAIVAGIAVFAVLLILGSLIAYVTGFVAIPNKGVAFGPPVQELTDIILYGLGIAIVILLIGGAILVIILLSPRRQDFPSGGEQPRAIPLRIMEDSEDDTSRGLKSPVKVVDANTDTHDA